MRITSHTGLTSAFAVVFICMAAAVRAQAWLPDKGTLELGLSYYDVFNKYHWQANGSTGDFGHTRIHSEAFSASYGITNRIMIAAGIPFVSTRYHGAFRHPSEVDDSHEHGTFTDLRVEMHYQLRESPLAFAPYVAVVIPTHHYETLGHAAPGRGLNEYWMGFYAGRVLDQWIPRTYIQLRYSYAFVERVVGIAHDRSNLDLTIGYFVTPEVSIGALAFWAQTHGGIDIPVRKSSPLFPHHDQLASERFVNVGGSVSWAFRRNADLAVFYATGISGRNGHKLDQGLNIALGYRLGAH